MNLFAVCSLNNPSLEREFHNLVSSLSELEKDILLRFIDIVTQRGQIAINMRPLTLLDLLASKRFMNIYEWVDSIVRKSAKDKDEILREKLGVFYQRRIAFDSYFEGGRGFRYGTLNIGGLGSDRYGEYCVIIDASKLIAGGQLGYLGGDSLRSYVTLVPSVDEAKLRTDCSTDQYKQFLVALKQASNILPSHENQWPSLICNHDEYIEAIFTEEVQPDQIITVRISEVDYNLYWEYAFNEFREKLNELDRYRVDTFARIDGYLDELGVGWEPVDND